MWAPRPGGIGARAGLNKLAWSLPHKRCILQTNRKIRGPTPVAEEVVDVVTVGPEAVLPLVR